MKIIAKVDIGGYKKGQEVPKEKAELWAYMYPLNNPCEYVQDAPVKVTIPTPTPAPKAPVKKGK